MAKGRTFVQFIRKTFLFLCLLFDFAHFFSEFEMHVRTDNIENNIDASVFVGVAAKVRVASCDS